MLLLDMPLGAVREMIPRLEAAGLAWTGRLVQRALSLGVDMPISSAVVALLDGQVSPSQAVASLMGRDAKVELG